MHDERIRILDEWDIYHTKRNDLILTVCDLYGLQSCHCSLGRMYGSKSSQQCSHFTMQHDEWTACCAFGMPVWRKSEEVSTYALRCMTSQSCWGIVHNHTSLTTLGAWGKPHPPPPLAPNLPPSPPFHLQITDFGLWQPMGAAAGLCSGVIPWAADHVTSCG